MEAQEPGPDPGGPPILGGPLDLAEAAQVAALKLTELAAALLLLNREQVAREQQQQQGQEQQKQQLGAAGNSLA